MRQYAQLDLTVIGVNKDPALARDEHLADLASKLSADGDVLKVRVSRGQPSRGRDHVLERGMDASVLRDLFEKAVCISRFELCQHPVVEHARNDGVPGPQLFEDLRIGGVAAFCLFDGRQAEPVKQDLPELFRGIDVEFLASIAIDRRLCILDPLREHLPKRHECKLVGRHALMLHAREHRAKRQLHVVIKRLKPHFPELFLHRLSKRRDGRRAAEQVCKPRCVLPRRSRIELRRFKIQIRDRQLLKLIASLRRVDEIRSQRRVKAKILRRKPRVVKLPHQSLDIVRRLADAASKELPQDCVKFCAKRFAAEIDHVPGIRHLRRDARKPALGRHGHIRLRRKLLKHFLGTFCRPRGLGGTFSLNEIRLFLRAVPLRPQLIAVDELQEFQLDKQVIERPAVRLAHHAVLRAEQNRRIASDGRKVIREICLFAVCLQLLPQIFTDLRQMLINTVERPVLQQQTGRRLRPHTRNAGDVVGAVAHQALEIDQALRCKAVFGGERRLIVKRGGRLAALGRDELHMHVRINELEAVAVTGDDHALPAVFPAQPPDGAEHVVGLPALTLKDGNVHRAQNVLHIRKLHGKLVRHRVARGLIAVVLQMAECGRFEIERHAQRVRRFLLAQTFENI